MSKKNYFKERIMLLILLFAFMTPFGALEIGRAHV